MAGYFRKAEEWNYEGAFKAGATLTNGLFVYIDGSNGVKPIAEAGDADAWMSVAYFYLRGNGVEADKDKALEFYLKAAEAGSHLACDYVGYLYMTGSIVSQDVQKGLEWYPKAAELGNARSMYALGYAYQCGQGVEMNMEEALRWYEKAALAGHATALVVYNAFK